MVTETNAEKAIEELKAYQADLATVLRDGRLRVVKASALVPGDIIELAVGAKVPADCRITDFEFDVESGSGDFLTGEERSVEKEAGHIEDSERARRAVVQDKTCLLFSGDSSERWESEGSRRRDWVEHGRLGRFETR